MELTWRFLPINWPINRINVTLFLIILLVLYSRYGQLQVFGAYSLDDSISETLRVCPGLSFSNTKLPRTALASFPGSGNTWTRHLLQKMTGLATGSIYNSKILLGPKFPGENRSDGSVIAIKTHRSQSPKVHYDRCLLLIRNPYEAFLAEFKRSYSVGHSKVGQVKLDKYIQYWNDFFNRMTTRYQRFYLSWFDHEDVYIIFYDNLTKDLSSELTNVLKFLQKSINITGNVQCASENSEGTFHRNNSNTCPLDFFYSETQIEKLNTIIEELHKKATRRFQITSNPMETWIM